MHLGGSAGRQCFGCESAPGLVTTRVSTWLVSPLPAIIGEVERRNIFHSEIFQRRSLVGVSVCFADSLLCVMSHI